MPFIIAIVILGILAIVWVRFRCYVCFNFVIIGVSLLIAGSISDESIFTTGGWAFLVGGLLIMFITSLKVERSRRPYYMLNLFLSGLFSFLQMITLMLIITIPLMSIMKAMATDYRERVIVDCCGNKIGTAYTDDYGNSIDGKKYTPYDPYD